MSATDRIISKLVPEWVEHQKLKGADYNTISAAGEPIFENADVLGIRGQFSDIWRKIWKLKKGMWDGETLVAEQPREILMDLIGHCFLAIDMIDRKAGERFEADRRSQVKSSTFAEETAEAEREWMER